MPKRIQDTAWSMAIGLGLLAASAVPVVAQNTSAITGNTAAMSSTANTDSDKAPTGSLEKYHGLLRASELNGANVYNDQGNAIGTINDMLVGDDGKVQSTVISVGGFLGIGTHYVSVPFSQLQVQQSRSRNTGTATGDDMTGLGATATKGTATVGNAMTSPVPAPTTTATGTGMTTGTTTTGGMAPAATGSTMAAGNAPPPQYFSVVLPGATKESLTKMAEFHYQS